jgi:hypothetical protein
VNGRRVEHQHYTPEQVVEHLQGALDVVDTLGPPDDLRVACFTKAADLLAAKTATVEQVTPLAAALVAPRGV